MNLEPIEVFDTGMTLEESYLATEAKGKELECEGKEKLIVGMLTRAKAYQDYIDEMGASQRETAKFFGVGKATISRYLQVGHTVQNNKEEVLSIENLSLREILKIGKSKKEKNKEDEHDMPEVNNKELGVLRSENVKLKEEIERLKVDVDRYKKLTKKYRERLATAEDELNRVLSSGFYKNIDDRSSAIMVALGYIEDKPKKSKKGKKIGCCSIDTRRG